jgi:hypothetical protein
MVDGLCGYVGVALRSRGGVFGKFSGVWDLSTRRFREAPDLSTRRFRRDSGSFEIYKTAILVVMETDSGEAVAGFPIHVRLVLVGDSCLAGP